MCVHSEAVVKKQLEKRGDQQRKKRFSDLEIVQIGDYKPRNISSGGFNNIEESLRTCFCYTTRWYFESYQCKNSGWKQGLRTMFASAAAAVCSRRRYTLSAKTGNWIWRTIFKNSEKVEKVSMESEVIVPSREWTAFVSLEKTRSTKFIKARKIGPLIRWRWWPPPTNLEMALQIKSRDTQMKVRLLVFMKNQSPTRCQTLQLNFRIGLQFKSRLSNFVQMQDKTKKNCHLSYVFCRKHDKWQIFLFFVPTNFRQK